MGQNSGFIGVGPAGNPAIYDPATAWSKNGGAPGAAQATATQAAAGAGKRNYCTGLTVIAQAGGTAPTAATVTVALIDGPSGGTTYLWGPIAIGVPNIAGAMNGAAPHGPWVGSANTPMTLEFSAGLGSNTLEAVTFSGFVVNAL